MHGAWFWIRPLVVEVVTGLLFVGLYLVDTQWITAHWLMAQGIVPRADLLTGNLPLVFHARFLSHVVLAALLLVASLIDFDEQSIPDAITLSGTLAGLAFAVLYPWSLPGAGDWMINGSHQIEFINLASPDFWPDWLDGFPLVRGWVIAIACWTAWCVALMPRSWNMRRGLKTALRVFFHRLRIERQTYLLLALWPLGAAAITAAAWQAPAASWTALVSALVGMAAGGGVIWAVRLIGGYALKREAMGFGDVTLMAMIGAFVGWQGAWIVFFIAPFAGAVIALLQFIVRGEREVPYGPFLCLATLGVIVEWAAVWDRTAGVFSLGWMVVVVAAGCLALMAPILIVVRMVRKRLGSEP